MILTTSIELQITSGNIKLYEDRFPGINVKDILKINASELNPGSTKKIHCKCDYCGNERITPYYKYLSNIKDINKFSCNKCKSQKYADVCLLRYGVTNTSKIKEVKEKRTKTMVERFGVENISQSKEMELKKQATTLKNYGVKKPLQSKVIYERLFDTCEKRFGARNINTLPEIREKIKNTNMERYGVACCLSAPEIIEKIKKTNLEKLGCEWPMQNEKVLLKGQMTAFKRKKYKDLTYQGTYELDFLEKFYDQIIISKASRIPYLKDNKQHYYLPDFYIKELNLVIEVKSCWTYNKIGRDKNLEEINLAKKRATLDAGFNYIMILDKDYQELKTLITLDPRALEDS